MSGYDLPHEADLSLTWHQAIGYLERLMGDEVVVWMDIGRRHDRMTSGGRLRKVDVRHAYAFSVGTAVVTLPVDDFTSASLSTRDGADYFTLCFHFGEHVIWVGQPDLHGTDYQEDVWARYAEADEGS